MPNWCHNTLTVSGSPEEVDRFIKENTGDEGESLVFSKAVPEPTYDGYDDGSSRTTKEGLPTWYDWRCENWGTKWDPYLENEAEEKIIESGEEKTKVATYHFDTAWGPGDVWFDKVIAQYKNLKFCLTYGEAGSDFGGAVIADNGEIISNTNGSASDYLSEDMMWC